MSHLKASAGFFVAAACLLTNGEAIAQEEDTPLAPAPTMEFKKLSEVAHKKPVHSYRILDDESRMEAVFSIGYTEAIRIIISSYQIALYNPDKTDENSHCPVAGYKDDTLKYEPRNLILTKWRASIPLTEEEIKETEKHQCLVINI